MRRSCLFLSIIILGIIAGSCSAPPSENPSPSEGVQFSVDSSSSHSPSEVMPSGFQIVKKSAFDAWDTFREKTANAVKTVGYGTVTVNISYSTYNNALSAFEKLALPIVYLHDDMIKPGRFNPVSQALDHYNIVRSLLLDLETNEGRVSHQTILLLEKCYRDLVNYMDDPNMRRLDSILYDTQYNDSQLSDKSVTMITNSVASPDLDLSCLNYWLVMESTADEFSYIVRDAQFKE